MSFWNNERPLLMDGGMGTLLQARGLRSGEKPETWNINRPDDIVAIHRAYRAAGAQVMTTNTFGANRLKYPEGLNEIIAAGIACARKSLDDGNEGYVALDVGPTGKLLEPLGDLLFEEAVEIFREIGMRGKNADLFLVETMTDLTELRAAVLGLKAAAPKTPIFATCTLEENGRLLTGGSAAAVAVTLEGMGVAALGLNCGAGPSRALQALPELLAATHLPVIVQPNAGLPVVRGGQTFFELAPEEFAEQSAELLKLGASVLGGCCGTTPAHIAALSARCKDVVCVPRKPATCPVIASASQVLRFGGLPVLIGERINPTGKKLFQQHLRAGDWDYILDEALTQAQAGAHALDVNVGMPGIDEGAAMLEAVTRLQRACPLPLQIDSAGPAVLEAALRRYNGKALINSVNGKEDSMRAVFPLAKKYGGVVVALLLDEDGIPATAEGRLAIAEKIYARAAEYGLGKADILIDALTMTVSAEPASAT
ncbi:MAG: homocysteine S-methyltransferase family protein, partial [Oscillospiraceae bacterium]|nr:homocysteine S-methyltransferase family protein [Oscillospiraceae bacterium]